jgi:hypothetical protein
MENLPLYIGLFFVLTTALAVFFFYKATPFSKLSVILILVWLTVITILSLNGFFTVTHTIPPRFIVLVLPPLLLIAALFFTAPGKQYMDQLDIRSLTLLHIVRIPVELGLFFLSLYKVVPELMTFEGRNLDILSGLSAPLIYYFAFVKKKIRNKMLLLWNIVCLLLLINIVSHAVLSAPSPFQQLAFAQPNIAVLYFPFVWLPGCIVPLVLFSHLVALRRLLLPNKETTANSVLPKAGLKPYFYADK